MTVTVVTHGVHPSRAVVVLSSTVNTDRKSELAKVDKFTVFVLVIGAFIDTAPLGAHSKKEAPPPDYSPDGTHGTPAPRLSA